MQEVHRLTDTTDTSYTRLDITARINQALELVCSWVMQSDGGWQWDDDNYTTNPTGKATLVSGQHEYTFADKLLDIIGVDILDTNGVYRQIKSFDASEVGDSFDAYFFVKNGEPTDGWPDYYDKVGNSIYLSHNPTAANVTLANGLRVRFKRTASLFTAVSTTAADTTVPGFASPFHVILSYMASIPYCMSYKPERVAKYQAFVGDTFPRPTGMKKAILDFYGNREKDKRKRATMRGIKYR